MSLIGKREYRGIHQFLGWVLLLALTAGIGFIGLLSTKMRLSGDDYCLDAVLIKEGLWGMVIRSYMEVSTYNGNRYSQIFFSGLAGHSPVFGNGVLVISSLIVWVIGLTRLARWIFRRLSLPASFLEILLIAEGYSCLVLWGTQRLDQSVIWRSAMTAYFLPMVAFTWLLLLIIWSGENKRFIGLQSPVIFLFAIISAGFSETGAVIQGGFLGLVILLILIIGRRMQKIKVYFLPMIIAILGVLTGVALMYFSPVTAIRRLALPETVNSHVLWELLIQNTRIYLWQTIMRRSLVLLIPFTFGLGLGIAQLVLKPVGRNFPFANYSWKRWGLVIIIVPIVSIFLILCVMLPATYVQGTYPPERALILAQSILTLASILGGSLLVLLINSTVDLNKVSNAGFRNILRVISIVLVFSVVVSPILLIKNNIDKLQFYNRWSQLWALRHEELLEAGRKNQDEVHVIELDHVVSDVGELLPNPDYWYNNCAEMYYGVKSIYADLPGW